MSSKRIFLTESEMPTAWYNIMADFPQQMPPPLHPGTKQPLTAAELEPIFAKELIQQEMSAEQFIDIPDEVLDIYKIWRPSPLVRATGLEKALKTPARIYFKDESHSPPGSHKPNSAVPQVYYNAKQGIRKLSTETGAGQWGSSLAFACSFFDVTCKVYMVRVSYEQKPYRRSMMHMWGASVTPSPSNETNAGRSILAQFPDTPGSLGIAISEAVEVAATNEDTNYTLGSVLNHVMLHQSIIGLEAEKQMAIAEDTPDVVIGCVGGGSNFAGLAFPFMRRKIEGKEMRIVAVEPRACPTMTRGKYNYDFGDTTQLTPLIKMFTLGHDFVPPGIHAGGLRYHGMSPQVSFATQQGLIDVEAYHQVECFEAAQLFAKAEGIIPAPESSHAIRGAVNEAIRCREENEEKCILFNLSGHGLCDLSSYDRYFAGDLTDFDLPQESIDASMNMLPEVE